MPAQPLSVIRRIALIAGLAGALAAAAPAAAESPTAVIQTSAGPVTGTATAEGVQAWLGIPFAAPPVGDLRWKPPQPVAAWTRPYPATRFAPSCMQPLRDHEIAYYVGDDPIAEDCLYLNVWAPAGAKAGAKLPVIVYIHGGSFVAGSGRKPLYVGDRLAAKGAVVVSINYRLGQLGFLAHPALTAESPERSSGDYGLRDQIAALAWVKANAEAFGGDPARVTLMGQSAGAMSIAALQVSPLAKGLFSRIAAFSGSLYSAVDTDDMPSLADAEARGVKLQAALGAADLAAMRRIPADRIIGQQAGMTPPIVDGAVIPNGPGRQYASGAAADVPLLLGVVRDEALSPLMSIKDLAGYRAMVARFYGDRAAAVLALYPAADDAAAVTSAHALAHDMQFAAMMRSWARMQTRRGKAPVFTYVFTRPHPYTPGVRFSDLDSTTTLANHTDEVAYWLGTFDSFNALRRTRDWTPADRALGDRMQAALVAFAASGDPNTPALGVVWPRYDAKAERTLILNAPITTAAWPDRLRMDRLSAIGAPR